MKPNLVYSGRNT